MSRIFSAILILLVSSMAAAAEDRREGYYYPQITSEEVFDRTLIRAPDAISEVRTAFITEITKALLKAPANPRFSIFTKGEKDRHMIIVALDDDVFKTLYRARAILAQLTSNARSTPFFQANNFQFEATWFDLAKLLGFEDIVITDGDTWAHKIVIQ